MTSKRRRLPSRANPTVRAVARPRTVPRSPSTTRTAVRRAYASTWAGPGRHAGASGRGRASSAVALAVAADDPEPLRSRGRRSACRSSCRPSAGSGRRAGRATSARLPPGSARRARSAATRRRSGRTATRTLRGSCRAAASSRPRSTTQAPAVRGHEQPARGRQREERRLRLLDADDLADLVEHGAAGRAQEAGDDDERQRDRRDRLPRAAGGVGSRSANALRTTAHERSRASCSPGSRSARSSFLTPCSFSESSPRRRRELTVPRGRPSSSAISPGVYSSRWRRTITARCSGGSAASAPSSDSSSGPRARARLRVDELGLAAQLARPRPVDRAVDDDPVQPRAEGPAAVEAVEVADGGEEGLLRDVLGGGRVVDDEIGGPVRPRPVQPKERLDPRGGPSLRRAHGGALVAAGGHPLTLRPAPRERSIVTRRMTKHASWEERATWSSLERRAARRERRRASLRERRRQDPVAEALLHVVRAGGHGRRAEQPAVERMHAQDGVVAARHERAVAHEGDVLRRRVAGERPHELRAGVVDREAAAVARRHPDAAAAGREADVVGEERRPDRARRLAAGAARESRARRSRLGLVAERDPEPRPDAVDPEMAAGPPTGTRPTTRRPRTSTTAISCARRVGDVGEARRRDATAV